MQPKLEDAARLLNAGREQEAAEAAATILRTRGEDVAALHLLGVALTRLGKAGEAVPRLQRASVLSPGSSPLMLALGNAHRGGGDLAAARGAYEEALRFDPGNAAARYRLAEALFDLGDLQGAAGHFARVAAGNPEDFQAVQRCVDCTAALARSAPRGAGPQAPPRNRLGTVAVGMCTLQPARAEQARAGLERALAPAPTTFHVRADAASLAEAYNRILDGADADVVILCHDDIEPLDASFHEALALALATADIVGVAGADLVTGPAVLWAGHPHVHGWVTYPREGGTYEAAPLSLRSGVLGGMQSLDGVFIAMTRDAAKRMRFDATTFDGFHFYDLDFSYRAWREGLRLAVTTDIRLLHASEGRYDANWLRYGERFSGKFPNLAAPAASPHWYGARFASRAEVQSFYERLATPSAARELES